MPKITLGIKKLLEINAVGFSTVDKNNNPHSIAVASVKVFQNNIIISNINIKESIKNIEKNNNIAIVIWNKEWETARVGFELKGKAKNYTSGKWFDFVKKMPENEGYKVKSAIVVKIEKIKKLIS
ncbi:MAG: pyridoxamine 5'-phosphate oxidase family protein [Candidatus Moranbacteria bacterium]|nr:pyridoxamine 5'-phosphate oxidase family protein [Candidatus Moranbacteria bacterium]